MKIKNTRGGSIGICINDERGKTIGKITLKAGDNELTEKQLEQLKESPYFQCFVDAGHIVVDSVGILKSKKGKKTSKVNNKPVKESVKELNEEAEDTDSK